MPSKKSVGAKSDLIRGIGTTKQPSSFFHCPSPGMETSPQALLLHFHEKVEKGVIGKRIVVRVLVASRPRSHHEQVRLIDAVYGAVHHQRGGGAVCLPGEARRKRVRLDRLASPLTVGTGYQGLQGRQREEGEGRIHRVKTEETRGAVAQARVDVAGELYGQTVELALVGYALEPLPHRCSQGFRTVTNYVNTTGYEQARCVRTAEQVLEEAVGLDVPSRVYHTCHEREARHSKYDAVMLSSALNPKDRAVILGSALNQKGSLATRR